MERFQLSSKKTPRPTPQPPRKIATPRTDQLRRQLALEDDEDELQDGRDLKIIKNMKSEFDAALNTSTTTNSANPPPLSSPPSAPLPALPSLSLASMANSEFVEVPLSAVKAGVKAGSRTPKTDAIRHQMNLDDSPSTIPIKAQPPIAFKLYDSPPPNPMLTKIESIQPRPIDVNNSPPQTAVSRTNAAATPNPILARVEAIEPRQITIVDSPPAPTHNENKNEQDKVNESENDNENVNNLSLFQPEHSIMEDDEEQQRPPQGRMSIFDANEADMADEIDDAGINSSSSIAACSSSSSSSSTCGWSAASQRGGRVSLSGAASRTPKRGGDPVLSNLTSDDLAPSSVVVLQILKARKTMEKKLGSPAFLSPVRRSLRINPAALNFIDSAERSATKSENVSGQKSASSRATKSSSSSRRTSVKRRLTLSAMPENLDQNRLESMLEESNFAYVPNPALAHRLTPIPRTKSSSREENEDSRKKRRQDMQNESKKLQDILEDA